MNDVNNMTATLVEVAHLYYEENLSQQEIADRLGVSRPLIALYLKQAREKGIVHIEIRNPNRISSDLAEKLRKSFNLQHVTVLPASHTSIELTRLSLGKAASRFLENTLQNGDVVGFGWGRSTEGVVSQLEPPSPVKLEAIPLMGENSNTDSFTQVNFLVHQVALKFGGKPFFLLAPMVLGSAQLKKDLAQDKSIRQTIERWDRLTLACIGIGALPPAQGQVMYIDEEDAVKFITAGAIGDVCARYLDENGKPVKNPIEDRLLGITLDQLRKVPRVVVVTCGLEKAAILSSALRAKLVSDLFIDEDLARAVLKMMP